MNLAVEPSPPAPSGIQAELEHLARMATAVLNEHVNEHGLCAICRCAFPCQSALLADHNVALL